MLRYSPAGFCGKQTGRLPQAVSSARDVIIAGGIYLVAEELDISMVDCMTSMVVLQSFLFVVTLLKKETLAFADLLFIVEIFFCFGFVLEKE